MSALEASIVVAIWVVIFLPGVITAAKGHIALFAAGWVVSGLVWPIAAWRLAKPNSPWAHRFYPHDKLHRSRRRYPDIDPSVPSRAGLAAAIGFGLFAAAFVAGLIAGLS
jgi:hypothetical protein